ncbi:class I SAM-dependent methyltransferase [Negadavirga shengliensis]|uniref:Class I SAM-dependent methyltransferase n=1 Tax=Negadavirga shengliensis TaxID=1389218 RepID=A0ABV9T548_9BACT
MIKKEYVTHKREPFFQIALDYIKDDSKVLDIGAGNGDFSKYCDRDDFYLYDGNIKTVEYLKKYHKNVFHGMLPVLPFENEFFDVIHCSHVVEHLQPQDMYDFLVNVDKVLKTGGYLVISTPLLWSGFYNDLSHVKPYRPFVFEKYLCGIHLESLTRSPVSINYKKERLEFRYLNTSKELEFYSFDKNIFVRVFLSCFYRLKKRGLGIYSKTGYTIVLKKNG